LNLAKIFETSHRGLDPDFRLFTEPLRMINSRKVDGI